MAKKTSRKTAGRKKTPRRPSPGKRAAPRAQPRAEESAPAPPKIELADISPADLTALKDGKLYYRIGEVSQITGVKAYVLRYWESEFRLMSPQKSRSKQRLYRQKDIETILTIKRLLYQDRYTIAGARRKLRELGSEARAELVTEVVLQAEARQAAAASFSEQLRRVRDELLAIRSMLAAEA
jgi:DNA-binding transcriptional MerR regulator